MELGIKVFAGSNNIGPGRRRVWTHVYDPRYEGLRGVFSYDVLYVCPPAYEDPNGPIDTELLLGALMHGIAVEWASDDPPEAKRAALMSVSYMRDLPMSTWEVASRERLSLALISDKGKHLLRDVPTEPVEITANSLDLSLETIDVAAEALVRSRYDDIDLDTPAGRRRHRSLMTQARAAVFYQSLIGSGRTDPAGEIAKAYNVTPGAARTWIHRARQSGFLGKALGNTAGQQPQTLPQERETP